MPVSPSTFRATRPIGLVIAGAVELLDSSNNVLGTAYLSGVGQGGLNILTPGNVITVAGTYRAWTSTRESARGSGGDR